MGRRTQRISLVLPYVYFAPIILTVSIFLGSKGRYLYLLKAKSKISWKQKERKKFKPYLPDDMKVESLGSTSMIVD